MHGTCSTFLCMRLLFLLLVPLLLPASAEALEMKPRDRDIVYGEETVLRVRSDMEGDRWQLRQSSWPYKEVQTVGEWSAERKSLPVQPSRNTRYRVFLLQEGQVVEQSSWRMVWVAPLVENNVQRTSSYLFASGTLRFDEFFWKDMKRLPPKQKKIYLYSRCTSSAPWSLQGSASLRIKLFSPRIFISWQTSATLPCRRAGYRTVGFFYLPGILPSGDEGLGRPQISQEEALVARKLLGRKEMSAKQMKKYFPVS